MNTGNVISSLLIVLVVLAVIFLILREFVCWYWKINTSIALLTEIRDLLAQKGALHGNAHSHEKGNNPPLVVDPFTCPPGTSIGAWREDLMKKHDIKKGQAVDTYIWNNNTYDSFDKVISAIKNNKPA